MLILGRFSFSGLRERRGIKWGGVTLRLTARAFLSQGELLAFGRTLNGENIEKLDIFYETETYCQLYSRRQQYIRTRRYSQEIM